MESTTTSHTDKAQQLHRRIIELLQVTILVVEAITDLTAAHPTVAAHRGPMAVHHLEDEAADIAAVVHMGVVEAEADVANK